MFTRKFLIVHLLVGIPAIFSVRAADLAGNEQMHAVPLTEADGKTRSVQTRICFPAKLVVPARVVVINHGSPVAAEERAKFVGFQCSALVMRWFLDRGFIAVSPIRRGYGATGGDWAETFGTCREPDFVRGGLETARDIEAAVNFATALPQARADGVVVVGQSAGGWGALAYAS